MLFHKKQPKKSRIEIDDRLQHIALIMDGNGRWAQKRGLPREQGHAFGCKTFERVSAYCRSLGIRYMTVYAFSTENWKRPQKEVDSLMRIFDNYLNDYLRRVAKNDFSGEDAYLADTHVRFIGDLRIFPDALREKMERVDQLSAKHAFVLNIAVNYGGREELAHACTTLIAEGVTNVTEQDISRVLYTAPCPDPDLVVRTGGDLRISNFLLWQSAYAEYYFTDTLWPDLSNDRVDEAIAAFYSRKRRYGGV